MKRNEHTALVKKILMMEDDVKRERKMSEHGKVGKCMKKDLHSREKLIDELEV
jgi:hypothetical protein